MSQSHFKTLKWSDIPAETDLVARQPELREIEKKLEGIESKLAENGRILKARTGDRDNLQRSLKDAEIEILVDNAPAAQKIGIEKKLKELEKEIGTIQHEHHILDEAVRTLERRYEDTHDRRAREMAHDLVKQISEQKKEADKAVENALEALHKLAAPVKQLTIFPFDRLVGGGVHYRDGFRDNQVQVVNPLDFTVLIEKFYTGFERFVTEVGEGRDEFIREKISLQT